MTNYSNTEKEIIALFAVCNLIDEMVNFSNLVHQKSFDDGNVQFKTNAHAQLFNIWLVDFLSFPQNDNKKMPFGLDKPEEMPNLCYLFYLERICANPRLGSNVVELRQKVSDFSCWPAKDFQAAKTWLPSIGLELDLSVSRFVALKITGNTAKHNFTRLKRNVKSIQKTLKKNGHDFPLEECYKLMPDLQAKFFDDIFIYHSTEIVEFLNDIRWAIHDYLGQEYKRSYKARPCKHVPISYKFVAHENIPSPIAKSIHWDLMNLVRSKPIVPRFSSNLLFKKRFR